MNTINIAGGCYLETCEAPHWRAIYGSGGRAAHALVGQAPIVLHTYFPKARDSDLYPLAVTGIEVKVTDTTTAIAFAYFHPLSDPALAPERASIVRQPALRVEGDVVLRFGFVEGDAVVFGRRVVYDPQSVGNFAPYGQNGSSAESLALVLNADELRAATGQDDLDVGARALLDAGAEVVIAKRGVHGAVVYKTEGFGTPIPAFWSDAVFKIGTGDIFSAAFTHAWANLRQDPVAAATAASRAVAHYTTERVLPLPPVSTMSPHQAVTARPHVTVHLVGSKTQLANRWLFEEAAWRLDQLGADVRRWDGPPEAQLSDGACLVLADQIGADDLAEVVARSDPRRLVLLSETGVTSPTNAHSTADFTTALYWACWAS